MKKLIPLSLICLLLAGVSNLQAQTKNDHWGLTARLGFASYNGDLGNSMLQFGGETNMAYGLGLSYYISNSFDVAFDLSVVSLSKSNDVNDPVYAQRTTYFETNIVNLNALLRWKFLNSFMATRDSDFNPYLTAGLGAAYMSFGEGGVIGCSTCSPSGGPVPTNYATPKDPSDFVFSIPFGAGLNFEISEDVQLNVQAIYNRSFTDDVDQFPSAGNEEKDTVGQPDLDGIDHDDWLTTTVGLTFTFGGAEKKSMRKNKMLESMQNIEEDVSEINDEMDRLIELNEESINALEELQEELKMSDRQMKDLRAKFVRIVNNVQFAFDESYIIEPAQDELQSLANVMQAYDNLSIHLEAYADERGSAKYNKKLAQERAQSVKDFLTSHGVSASRVSIDVYGEKKALYEPPADADSQTVWAQNRAVQITLSYNGS